MPTGDCPKFRWDGIPIIHCRNMPGYVTSAENAEDDAAYVN